MLLPRGQTCLANGIPDLPTPVKNPSVAADDFTIYACGGQDIASATSKYKCMASKPNLASVSYFFSAVSSKCQFLDTRVDPLSWTPFQDLASPGSDAGMVFTAGHLYVFPDNGMSFHMWDKVGDVWLALANLPLNVSGTRGAVEAHGTKIYLVGGGTQFFFCLLYTSPSPRD